MIIGPIHTQKQLKKKYSASMWPSHEEGRIRTGERGARVNEDGGMGIPWSPLEIHARIVFIRRTQPEITSA